LVYGRRYWGFGADLNLLWGERGGGGGVHLFSIEAEQYLDIQRKPKKKTSKVGFKRIRRGKKTLTNCSPVKSVLLPMSPLPPSISNPNGLVELNIPKIFAVFKGVNYNLKIKLWKVRR
jgi:hypothetical protein